MSKYTERTLAKIARIDTEVSTLVDRLDSKLNERRLLLAGLITDGESVRGEVLRISTL